MKELFLFVIVFICIQFTALAQWTFKTPMPTGRGFTSGTIVDGKIYMIGGFPTHNSVTTANEMYDPATDTWTSMTSMPEGRCANAICTYDGKIYVFGGVSPDPYASAKNNVYLYDPQTDTWTQKANMPNANAFCGIAVVNDTIYLIGGMLNYAAPPDSTLMVYYPLTDTWEEKTPMPTARGMLSACTLDGKIYAIGGTMNFLTSSYNVVEIYDPATNTWDTTKEDMPTARVSLATCVMDGKIYAVGGYDYPVMYTVNEVYDPVLDTWTTKDPMQETRQTFFLGSVGDKIYAIGGSYPDPQNPAMPVILNSVEAYPTSNIETGDVSGTWTKANSPYNINGEITIPNDSTLIIEPGVEVVFTGHYKFNVQGRLLAIGTEADTIDFTINDTTGFNDPNILDGGWGGIKLEDIASSNDSTIFEYCSFQYGKTDNGGAINSNIDRLRISHCLFRNNVCLETHPFGGTGGAIFIRDSNPVIEYSEFCSNKAEFNGSALCIVYSDAIIRNNHFHHNIISAPIAINASAPIFTNNLIEQNHSNNDCILFIRNDDGENAAIINNTIVNNTCTQGAILAQVDLTSFINNLIYGNEPSQVYFNFTSSVGFYNCLIEGGKEGFTGATFTGAYENCIDADPQFVSSSDFHLQNTSPCIGAGIDSILINSTMYYCPPTDFEKNLRPNPLGSMPDIGAYESPEGIVGVEEDLSVYPTEYALSQNYPNPFNPSTKIKYSIPKLSFVSIKIYDVLGSEVATLVNEEKPIGTYELNWNAANLSSGVYFYQLKAGSYVETKKMILLK
jgi:N-acetylneuraminic acid mutarotase